MLVLLSAELIVWPVAACYAGTRRAESWIIINRVKGDVGNGFRSCTWRVGGVPVYSRLPARGDPPGTGELSRGSEPHVSDCVRTDRRAAL